MASRMERFHNEDNVVGTRVKRNKDLYKHIYDDEIYSNIEGVFETNSNTVNINKLKETIENEDVEKMKDLMRLSTTRRNYFNDK